MTDCGKLKLMENPMERINETGTEIEEVEAKKGRKDKWWSFLVDQIQDWSRDEVYLLP